MYNEIVAKYAKNPKNKFKMENATIEYQSNSRTCWDELVVFLKIDNWALTNWSFDWETTIIARACASIFWENIIWKTIDEIMALKYDYLKDLIELDLKWRKKQACAMWMIITRNALHKYLKDWKLDNYDFIK